jgi:hypothetical protein
VIGVGQNHPSAKGFKLFWAQAFNRGQGANRHEHRDFHRAMGSMQKAITGARFLIDMFDLEIKILAHKPRNSKARAERRQTSRNFLSQKIKEYYKRNQKGELCFQF